MKNLKCINENGTPNREFWQELKGSYIESKFSFMCFTPETVLRGYDKEIGFLLRKVGEPFLIKKYKKEVYIFRSAQVTDVFTFFYPQCEKHSTRQEVRRKWNIEILEEILKIAE